ncbi:hypothetical protein V8E54_001705 [Elaphomyces granulatus]
MATRDLKDLFEGLEQGDFEDVLQSTEYSSFDIPDSKTFKQEKTKERRYRAERVRRKPRLPRKRKPGDWDSDESDNENGKRMIAHDYSLRRRRKKYPVKFEKTIGPVISLRHPISERQHNTTAKLASIPTLEEMETNEFSFHWIEDPLKRRNAITDFRRNQKAITPEYLEVTDDNRHMFSRLKYFEDGYVADLDDVKPMYRHLVITDNEEDIQDAQACKTCIGADKHHASTSCKVEEVVDMAKLFSYMK